MVVLMAVVVVESSVSRSITVTLTAAFFGLPRPLFPPDLFRFRIVLVCDLVLDCKFLFSSSERVLIGLKKEPMS